MKLLICLQFLVLFAAAADAGAWKYSDQANWDGQCPNNIRQSPIDIPCQQYLKVCPPGKGYQVYWKNPQITFGGSTYEDVKTITQDKSWVKFSNESSDYIFKSWQFHFHYPSEHTVDGKQYPLEVHFVHKLDSTAVTQFLVIGVFFEEDPTLAYDIFDAAPVYSNTTFTRLFPFALANKAAYHYLGSLTTPPCLEAVNWFVQTEPIKIRPDNLKKIIQKGTGPNNRQIQRLGARSVSLVGQGC